jgi:hypothetical protein
MNKPSKVFVALSLTLATVLPAVACTVPPEQQTGTSSTSSGSSGAPTASGGINTCGGSGWRDQTPAHSVICPGSSTCYCESPQVCCLDAIDSRRGSCTSFQGCSFIALTCDSPNDCGGGVCCLDERAGGGSTCKAATDCDSSMKWLCNVDADCKNGNMTAPGGPHCRPADLGSDPGVPNTALDYEIGLCSN